MAVSGTPAVLLNVRIIYEAQNYSRDVIRSFTGVSVMKVT